MPSFDIDDTIAAIASARGSSLRGIIRISGPTCVDCLESIFSSPEATSLKPFKSATVLNGTLRIEQRTVPATHPTCSKSANGEFNDGRLSEAEGSLELPGQLLFWPTRRSYTRQPSAEFHTFGSPPLLKLALASICQSGARLANPGEFTLRAFLSGRLDLTQAEAVLAIIDSKGQSQLDLALKQLAGGLTGPLTHARDQLKYVLAELEAGLDFVEEDIEFISQSDLLKRLNEVQQSVSAIAQQIASRDRESETVQVALIGMPNAGKSSLFNQLLGQHRAIVTQLAGTTTDFLSATLEIGGQRIELIDTAGLEPSDGFTHESTSRKVDSTSNGPADQTNPVSQQAQQQRGEIESNSQLRLLCLDCSRELTGWERDRIAATDDGTIIVRTKSDLALQASNGDLLQAFKNDPNFVQTSSLNAMGVKELQHTLADRVARWLAPDSEIIGSTVLRTAESLRATEQSVNLAIQATTDQAGEEVVASEIRQALDHLGLVVGTVYTDDILDVVFSRFCIGK